MRVPPLVAKALPGQESGLVDAMSCHVRILGSQVVLPRHSAHPQGNLQEVQLGIGLIFLSKTGCTSLLAKFRRYLMLVLSRHRSQHEYDYIVHLSFARFNLIFTRAQILLVYVG